MANILLTPQEITREALMVLHEKLNFIGTINRQYDDRFARSGAKIGDTLQIRKPVEFTVRTGMTMSVQDIEEKKVDLVLGIVKGVDFSFTSEELTLKIDDFSQRYLEPAMARLAADIEATVLSGVMKEIPQIVGTPGTTPNTLITYLQAKEKLNKFLAPQTNRYIRMPSEYETSIIDALKGLLHDDKEISRQYLEGTMGKAIGFSWGESEHIPTHQNGTAAGTPLVNGAGQTGSSLNTDGWTNSATIKAGTVIEIAGVYAVHPETKQRYGFLKQFVVTADVTTGGVVGDATLQISPPIITSGAYQNVSNAPADNAAITVKTGSANTSYSQALAYHRDFATFVTADLFIPDNVPFKAREKYDNISIAMVGDFDIVSRKMQYRLDVLFGFKVVRPELAVRIIGA